MAENSIDAEKRERRLLQYRRCYYRHREVSIARSRDWKERHKAEIAAKKKIYDKERYSRLHKQIKQRVQGHHASRKRDTDYRNKRIQYAAKYRKENAEKLKKYISGRRSSINSNHRSWYSRNKERLATERKAQWQSDLEGNRKKAREAYYRYKSGAENYRKNNKLKIRANHKRWAKENIEHVRIYQRVAQSKRRSKLVTTPLELERLRRWIQEVQQRPLHICYFCKSCFVGTPHIDHVIAIANGGAHSISNCAVSCPDCNWSKQARTFLAWPKRGQMFLNL